MKQSSKASWRLEAALAALALLFFLTATARAQAPAAPAQPPVHFTTAEVLQQSPAHPLPVTETVDAAALQGTWVPATLPLIFNTGGGAPGLRTTWVRVRLDAVRETRGPLEFYMMQWFAPGLLAVYADGHLVYRSPGSPVWNLFRHPSVKVPLGKGVDSRPPATILMRVDWVPTRIAAVSSFYVGEAQAVVQMAERRSLWIDQIPFMFSAGFVLVGIFALGVWVFRRQYPGHLIFFISIFSMTRRWHFQLGIERLPVSDAWFAWLTLNALVWQVIATHFLLEFLHGRRRPRVSRVLLGLGVALSLLTLPFNLLSLPVLLSVRSMAQFAAILLALFVAVTGVWHSWRARSSDASLLAWAFMFSFVCGVIDYVALLRLTDAERFFLTPYSALLYSLTIIYLMFRRYVRVMSEIETLNVTLEARAKVREAELAESYARLREIEHRQTLSDERTRLMQDMHDGLGSSLTSALRVVENRGGDADLREVLKSCIDDLKLTIDSMEPVEADLLLLLATLRYRLGPRLKSAGITLRWEVVDVPRLDWLDPRTSLYILRIVQEAFSNILKHTQATEIRVATGADAEQVWVSITDNGPGFDPEEARLRGGRGLDNQRRRAAELNGEVRWEFSGAGTRLLLLLPRHRSPTASVAQATTPSVP